ncbi:MAG TPA: hypothetical protein PKD53_05465 [Chloroflexaceae bacterium]|nr:hypothetical protein [Chloroflexaceae bacterium]
MSRTARALIALALVVAPLTLVVLLGAATPQRAPAVANSLAVVAAQEVPPTETSAPPTATPIPPTPTLARREFNESGAPKVAPTSFLPGRGPELPGEFVYAGRRLDFFVGRGTYAPEEVAELAIKAEHALSYLQKRFATSLSERVSVGVYSASQAPGRGTRGIAYTYGDTNVRIYYRPGEDKHKALVILSHELAHALQAEAYGKEVQRQADTVLLEGLASFISGEYWLSLSEAPSFHARAQELYRAGYSGSLAAMGRHSPDVAYDMWAGFVDYLTRTYGWDRFNLLYQSGRGRAPGSADYLGVYGKSFKELADEYYATLE